MSPELVAAILKQHFKSEAHKARAQEVARTAEARNDDPQAPLKRKRTNDDLEVFNRTQALIFPFPAKFQLTNFQLQASQARSSQQQQQHNVPLRPLNLSTETPTLKR